MLIEGTINGKYKIIDQIGVGGMGTVYKAMNMATKEIVAIKFLKESLNSENYRQRFSREFRALKKVNHRNVIRVMDEGIHEFTQYFVMEFIDGCSLAQFREKSPDGLIDTAKLISITIQICNALSYIHYKRIIHRDLKPGNIMIDKSGRAVLMDFGLIKTDNFSVTLTMQGEIVGTIAYMSPEQGQGLKINYNTDLYSLGIILYHCVTGRLPFTGTTPISVIYKHINEVPVEPREFNNNLDPRLERMILRLIEKDQAKRYQYAEEVIRDLQNLSSAPAAKTMEAFDMESSKAMLLTPPTIGRYQELEQIKHLIDESQRSRQFIFISGEAGIGKTRLMEDTIAHAHLMKYPTFRAAFSENKREPYHPFITILQAILEEKKTEIFAQLDSDQIQALQHLLPNLIDEEDKDSAPLTKKEIIFEAILRSLLAYTENKAFVLVIEDLQWGDNISLEVIEYLQNVSDQHPFAILSSYRTEELQPKEKLGSFIHEIETCTNCTKLELSSLEKTDVKRVIKFILGQGEISPGVVELITDKSGGNPLFIEEILKNYVAEKIIYRDKGNWKKVLKTEDLNIPDNVKEIVFRRFSSLDTPQRKILSHAAVIGMNFDFDTLSYLMNINNDKLLENLDEFITMKIIDEVHGFSQEMYQFKQTCFNEVLYNSLPDTEKQELHRKIAAYIENEIGQKKGLENYYESLAYHYDRGGSIEKSIKYLKLAGDRAKKIYANDKAIANYDRTLELIHLHIYPQEFNELKIEILLNKGIIYQLIGKNNNALMVYDEALDIALEVGNKKNIGRIYKNIGFTYRTQNDYDDAEMNYQNALNIFREIKDDLLEADTLNGMAAIYYFKADFEKGIAINLEIQKVYKRLKDDKGVAYCFNNIAAFYYRMGKYDNTAKYFRKAYIMLEKIGEKRDAIRALRNCATMMSRNGDLDNALKEYQKTASYFQDIDDKREIANTLIDIGNILWLKCDFRGAIGKYEEALEIREQTENKQGVAWCLNNIGEMYRLLGKFTEALTYQEKSLAAMEAVEDKHGIATSLCNMGTIYQNMYAFSSAIEYHNMALLQSKEIEDIEIQIDALRHLAIDHWLSGQYEQAEKYFEETLDITDDDNENQVELYGNITWMYLDWNKKEKAEESYSELKFYIMNNKYKLFSILDNFLEGRLKTEEDLLAEAVDQFRDIESPFYLWQAYYHLGKVYWKLNNPEETTRAYYKAFHTIKEKILPNIPMTCRGNFLNYPLVKDLQQQLKKTFD